MLSGFEHWEQTAPGLVSLLVYYRTKGTLRRVLQKPAHRVGYCYAKAAECRQRAIQTHNQDIKDELLGQEDRWIQLAQSLEFTQRLADFVAEAGRFIAEADRRSHEQNNFITKLKKYGR